MYGFHSPFDLKGSNASFGKLRHKWKQRKFLTIEKIQPAIIFMHRHIFAGAFFFDERIFPSAWMFAFSAIGCEAGHVVAYGAPAAIRKANRSVYEYFRFDCIADVLLDVLDAISGKFPSEIYAAGSEFFVCQDSLAAGGIGLGGYVQCGIEIKFLKFGKHAEVSYDECVDADIVKCLCGFDEFIIFFGEWIYVECGIAFAVIFVKVGDTLFGVVETEISGKAPQRTELSAEIDRVGSIGHSPFEFFKITGRCKQFGFFHLISSKSLSIILAQVGQCNSFIDHIPRLGLSPHSPAAAISSQRAMSFSARPFAVPS